MTRSPIAMFLVFAASFQRGELRWHTWTTKFLISGQSFSGLFRSATNWTTTSADLRVLSLLRNGIPNELLQNISMLAVSNTIEVDTPVEIEAWIITQVCRRWRGSTHIERTSFSVLAQQSSRWKQWRSIFTSIVTLPRLPLRSTSALECSAHCHPWSDTGARHSSFRVSWFWDCTQPPERVPVQPAHPSSTIAPRVTSLISIRLVSRPKYLTAGPQTTCCGFLTCAVIDQRISPTPSSPGPVRHRVFTSARNPRLEELVVFEHVVPVISLLRRSTCSLKRLVYFTCSDPTSIIGILEITPTIVKLCVQVAALQPHDLDLIARPASDDPAFAPNPAVISLDVEFGPNDAVLFLDALESRWRGGKLRASHGGVEGRGIALLISTGNAQKAWFPADLRFDDAHLEFEWQLDYADGNALATQCSDKRAKERMKQDDSRTNLTRPSPACSYSNVYATMMNHMMRPKPLLQKEFPGPESSVGGHSWRVQIAENKREEFLTLGGPRDSLASTRIGGEFRRPQPMARSTEVGTTSLHLPIHHELTSRFSSSQIPSSSRSLSSLGGTNPVWNDAPTYPPCLNGSLPLSHQESDNPLYSTHSFPSNNGSTTFHGNPDALWLAPHVSNPGYDYGLPYQPYPRPAPPVMYPSPYEQLQFSDNMS
ncbi:hypothetical protein C8R44DRAFT_754082 [Mycena epipterygia]|nr:hypothetical protein C8R44DRAFT_754082 [Mycena epipterygia]